LRVEIVCDLWFIDDDDRLDEVRVEGDDPRRVTDEDVDESW
jgi:hypothetical protein